MRVKTCAHCGRAKSYESGSASVVGLFVCHPNDDGPDCYRLITVYGETIGQRLAA